MTLPLIHETLTNKSIKTNKCCYCPIWKVFAVRTNNSNRKIRYCNIYFIMCFILTSEENVVSSSGARSIENSEILLFVMLYYNSITVKLLSGVALTLDFVCVLSKLSCFT